MKNLKLVSVGIILFCLSIQAQAQIISQEPMPPEVPINMDGKKTLQWTIERSTRIEKLINSAMLSHDQINLMMRLLDVYVEFDAISLVGLYCYEAQSAAEKGRESSDLVNFRKEKDFNTMMLRALEAKEQAIKVRMASISCLNSYDETISDTIEFAPNKVLIEEAQWAILDLEDGLASTNFHIFSQKTEHAIRLIEEIEHIASTLANCEEVLTNAETAKAACLAALGAPNWVAINRSVLSAKKALHEIEKAGCFKGDEGE